MEGQGHELLHQEVEGEGTEDAALGRPVLQHVGARPHALELHPGAAVKQVDPKPGNQLSLHALLYERGEDGVRADQLEHLLQIQDDD